MSNLAKRTAPAAEGEAASADDHYGAHREKWKFWARALIRGSEDLRAVLAMDEPNYRMIAATALGQGRDYFLYATLDEISKLGVAVMGWDEVVGQEELQPDDAVTRVILERTLNEQSFWSRKMLEVLIDLVCFSTTNEDPYYRHLLLLRDLRSRLGIQHDLERFYGAPSNNVAWSINHDLEAIKELEENDEVDLARAWYARHERPLETAPTRPDGIVTSVRGRLQTALPHMQAHEKLSIGLSYARHYGTTSEDIHFRPESTLRDISSDAIASEIDRNAVTGIAALIRVQILIGQVPEGVNEALRTSFDGNTFPAEVLRRRTRDRADIADFVLAGGDLGEVVEKRESKFGYEVYRVRFLAEMPLPGVEEDWFLAEHVERFYTLAEFKRRLTASIESGEVPTDALERFERLAPDQQLEAVRESLLATWEHAGLREWVRRRQAEAAAGRSWAGVQDPAT